MAFERVTTQVPTSIAKISVVLTDHPEYGKAVHYQVVILDQEGFQIPVPNDTGNLQPHLTAAQLTQLSAFMDSLRVQAESQFLSS